MCRCVAGYPLDIYVVSDGRVLPFLQDAIYDTQLPILPPEIGNVKISWVGPDDKVRRCNRITFDCITGWCVRVLLFVTVCLWDLVFLI